MTTEDSVSSFTGMRTFLLASTILMAATSAFAQSSPQPAAPPAATAPASSILTVERVFANPSLAGPVAKGVSLSPDGELVAFLRSREDDVDVLDLWAAPVKGGEPFKLIDARALVPDAGELSEAEKARRERMRISQRGVVEYSWDEQGRYILAPLEGDVFLANRADGSVRRLTETAADEIDAKVSPKGAFVSFVRDQNLFLVNLETGAEQAITTDGKDLITWATAEFIAQEELDRDTGYWWSPNERYIALQRTDESTVDVIPRLDITGGGASVISQRYPRRTAQRRGRAVCPGRAERSAGQGRPGRRHRHLSGPGELGGGRFGRLCPASVARSEAAGPAQRRSGHGRQPGDRQPDLERLGQRHS